MSLITFAGGVYLANVLQFFEDLTGRTLDLTYNTRRGYGFILVSEEC